MRNILITGGTGLVGRQLTQLLKKNGYEVALLSRGKSRSSTEKTFHWDPVNQTIDKEAILWADAIVHLAGAGVADKRWTKAWKKEIADSRVLGTRLLATALKTIENHSVKTVVCASAIGIYGADTGPELLEEASSEGTDFLSVVTKNWETEAEQVATLGIRTAILRIGIVLSPDGGALQKMAAPIKAGVGAVLGTGNQYISWIHVGDLCEMFLKALNDETMFGTFNAVAPNPVTNREFTLALANKLHKKIGLPAVPAFALKLLLGQMSEVLLGGNNVSCRKILETGFQFKYRTLDSVLNDSISLKK